MSRMSEGPVVRTLKHGYLWLMLALVFLPFYIMLIVSFKNNWQFYNHTWVPSTSATGRRPGAPWASTSPTACSWP